MTKPLRAPRPGDLMRPTDEWIARHDKSAPWREVIVRVEGVDEISKGIFGERTVVFVRVAVERAHAEREYVPTVWAAANLMRIRVLPAEAGYI